MRKLTIFFVFVFVKINMNNACQAETVIILNEALINLCESLDKPVEQALTIAYSLLDKGELFEELEGN